MKVYLNLISKLNILLPLFIQFIREYKENLILKIYLLILLYISNSVYNTPIIFIQNNGYLWIYLDKFLFPKNRNPIPSNKGLE